MKRKRLENVTVELNNIDARKINLINEKQELETWLSTNDPKIISKVAKENAIAVKQEAKANKKIEQKIEKDSKRKRL